MLSLILFVTVLTLCIGASVDLGGLGEKTQLQGSAFGYEILEHRLDNLQNTFFQLFTSMEKAEQTRLESQRAMLEQLQKGIKVQTVNRGNFGFIEDCMQAEISGRYLLRPPGSSKWFPVFCETESFGGGWIVIQQRINGRVNFYRDWERYKNGFGSIGKSNDFWFGLEKLHQLTKNYNYELAVELKNESGRYGYALHSNFQIAGEDDHYRLSSSFEFIEGNIESKMRISYGEKFSTHDKDNDKSSDDHCGSQYKSGWWFYQCKNANLNGPYNKDPQTGRGIFWDGFANAATYSRMMIRPM